MNVKIIIVIGISILIDISSIEMRIYTIIILIYKYTVSENIYDNLYNNNIDV